LQPTAAGSIMRRRVRLLRDPDGYILCFSEQTA
jgi:hypothetical protein